MLGRSRYAKPAEQHRYSKTVLFKSFYGAQAILHDKEYLAMLEYLQNEEDRDAGLTTRSDYIEAHDLIMIARQQHQKETVMMECRLNVKSTELRHNGFMCSSVFSRSSDSMQTERSLAIVQ